jgi:hypothetical protein
MDARFVKNVLIKGLVLFLVINLLWTGIKPESLGKISIYNSIIPGRERFPFGEDSTRSYNLSLYNLEAMFSSHVISAGIQPVDPSSRGNTGWNIGCKA